MKKIVISLLASVFIYVQADFATFLGFSRTKQQQEPSSSSEKLPLYTKKDIDEKVAQYKQDLQGDLKEIATDCIWGDFLPILLNYKQLTNLKNLSQHQAQEISDQIQLYKESQNSGPIRYFFSAPDYVMEAINYLSLADIEIFYIFAQDPALFGKLKNGILNALDVLAESEKNNFVEVTKNDYAGLKEDSEEDGFVLI